MRSPRVQIGFFAERMRRTAGLSPLVVNRSTKMVSMPCEFPNRTSETFDSSYSRGFARFRASGNLVCYAEHIDALVLKKRTLAPWYRLFLACEQWVRSTRASPPRAGVRPGVEAILTKAATPVKA